MITINRNNYEQYFIDFFDEELASSDKDQLISFLEQNPDLKEELESFTQTPLFEDKIKLTNKSLLKRESILNEPKKENFDELCIAAIEGDLTNQELLEFDRLISDKKKRNFRLYELTKIQADNSLVYSHKENLKKSVKKNLVFSKPHMYISVAASILVLLAIYLFIPKTDTIEIPGSDSNLKVISESTVIKNKENIVKDENSKQEILNSDNTSNTGLSKQLIKVKHKEETGIFMDEPKEQNRPEEQKIAHLNPIQVKYHFDKKQIDIHQKSKVYASDETVAQQISEENISLKAYLVKVINKRTANKKGKEKIELFDIAQAGVKGINRITGSKMSLERIYDEYGNPDKTTFNSRLIAFSTPVKKELK